MTKSSTSITTYKAKISRSAKKLGLSYVGLFGSRARGEEKPTSDIDLLIKYSQPVGLIRHIQVRQEISKLLGKPVDLITKDGLTHYFKKLISKDLITLYESN